MAEISVVYEIVDEPPGKKPRLHGSGSSSLGHDSSKYPYFITFEDIDQLDIGHAIVNRRTLTNKWRFELLVSHWKPGPNYVFPRHAEGSNMRAFQHRWLEKIGGGWLAYSKMLDGAVCVPCSLFAVSRANRMLGAFVNRAMRRYNKAVNDFQKHAECLYHIEATESSLSFLSKAHDLGNFDFEFDEIVKMHISSPAHENGSRSGSPESEDRLEDAMEEDADDSMDCSYQIDPELINSIEPLDIATVLIPDKKLNDAEKYKFLKDCQKPEDDFEFPTHLEGEHKKSFQKNWLLLHDWLAYSKSLDGGMCVPCSLFKTAVPTKMPRPLVNRPLKRFKNAAFELKKHAERDYHRDAVKVSILLMNRLEKKVVGEGSSYEGMDDTEFGDGKEDYIDRLDIGIAVEKYGNCSDTEKYNLIKHHWKPGPEFVFPRQATGKRICAFQAKWLSSYEWLAYSKILDGGICVPCSMFAKENASRQLGSLVNRPLKRFNHATTDLKNHSECGYHKHSVRASCQFLRNFESKMGIQTRDEIIEPKITENGNVKALPVVDTQAECEGPDVAIVFEGASSRSDAEKYQLLMNTYWRPGSGFSFPRHQYGQKMVSFQRRWLATYPWLAYSKSLDGGVCIPCALFAAYNSNANLGALVTRALCSFKNGSFILKQHSEYAYHLTACKKSLFLINCYDKSKKFVKSFGFDYNKVNEEDSIVEESSFVEYSRSVELVKSEDENEFTDSRSSEDEFSDVECIDTLEMGVYTDWTPHSYECDRFDLGSVLEYAPYLCDTEKYNFLKKCWRPGPSYKFPDHRESSKKTFSFHHSWLTDYEWLVYSKRLNGGICLPCSLFHNIDRRVSKRRVTLVNYPLRAFRNAVEDFENHVETSEHSRSISLSIDLMNKMEGKSRTWDHNIDTKHGELTITVSQCSDHDSSGEVSDDDENSLENFESSYSDLHPYDAASAIQLNKLGSDEEKYDFLKNYFRPELNFEFPRQKDGKDTRSFQQKWLEVFDWLGYSKAFNGGVCIPCALFAKSQPNKVLGALVNRPLVKFKNAFFRFKKHVKCSYHHESMISCQQFLESMDNIYNINSGYGMDADDSANAEIVFETEPMDIAAALHVNEPLDDIAKYNLLKNHWKPSPTFIFPKHVERNNMRSFQYRWLQSHDWLAYSEKLDGGVCVPCSLFAKLVSKKIFGALVNQPFRRFRNAVYDLNQHSEYAYHHEAVKYSMEFAERVETMIRTGQVEDFV